MYLFVLIAMVSCNSHKILYAYEDSKSDIYAVLELSEKNYDVHFKYVNPKVNYEYIEILGKKNYSYDIGIPIFFDLFIIDNKKDVHVCGTFDNEQAFIYEKDKEQKDKIILIKKGQVKCLEQYGITQFPPHMTKVKKMDYSKFPEDIQEAVIAIDKGKSAEKVDAILAKAKKAN